MHKMEKNLIKVDKNLAKKFAEMIEIRDSKIKKVQMAQAKVFTLKAPF